MIEFDRLKCVRTDYFHNDCQKCFEICPEAVSFKNHITIDNDKLDMSVLSVCPSGAFSTKEFDKHSFIIKFSASQERVLSSSGLVPLEALSIHDLASIALRKEGFEVITQSTQVLQRIKDAQKLLQELGTHYEISVEEKSTKNRREFFSKIFGEIKNKDVDASKVYSYDSRIPQSLQIFKNSLKPKLEQLANTKIQSSFFHSKTIDFAACDNCSECVKFCPSDALFYNTDRTQIHFMQGSCIGCDICVDICHSDAIQNSATIDLIDLCFNKNKQLIEHTLVQCSECRNPFAQKEDETICKVCEQFTQKDDILALASEL